MKKVFILILILNLSYNFALNSRDNNFMYKKTIAIDLDGVLDEYNGKYNENNIPKIKKGAKEFVKELSNNYELILFTTRNSKQATKWLKENNIDEYFKEITNIKPPAYIYLDNRALKFDGNYNETLNEIKNYKTYWNK